MFNILIAYILYIFKKVLCRFKGLIIDGSLRINHELTCNCTFTQICILFQVSTKLQCHSQDFFMVVDRPFQD